MNFKQLLLAAFIVVITSCNAKITNQADKISYSVAYGMCQGYCVTNLDATPQAFTTHRSSNYVDKKFPLLSDTKNIARDEWKALLKTYDWEAIQTMDSVYGCPGCADGGIATLTIANKNKFKTIRFEDENVPPAIKPLIDLLRTKTATIDLPSTDTTQTQTMAQYDFNNQSAIIRNYVCSRGCYQFVIETTVKGKKEKLYEANLGEAYKKDGLEIIFSGNYSSGKTEIKKPAPNDVPVRDFDATNITVKEIKAKN